jgi:type VI protein secretion system component VasA
MGLVNVVESNISETSEWFWNKVGPVVPNISLDTSAYNQHFVKLMMVAGVLTLGHLTVSGVKAVSKIKCHKPPTKEQIQSKYGKNAWALVVDVARN